MNKADQVKGAEFTLPVEDIVFLVKALLGEGLEIKEIRCSLSIGDMIHSVDLVLVDEETVVEGMRTPGGLPQ